MCSELSACNYFFLCCPLAYFVAMLLRPNCHVFLQELEALTNKSSSGEFLQFVQDLGTMVNLSAHKGLFAVADLVLFGFVLRVHADTEDVLYKFRTSSNKE